MLEVGNFEVVKEQEVELERGCEEPVSFDSEN
jgi:hypothetical protein